MRQIDEQTNEAAIERIRATFDALVDGLGIDVPGLLSGEKQYLCLPDDLVKPNILKPAEGDMVYGLNENGVETLGIFNVMGWALFSRDGSFELPDGAEERDPLDIYPVEEHYDYWYALIGEYVRVTDMPDKIEDPFDDEINVEAGFGDADVDGEPIDPEDN